MTPDAANKGEGAVLREDLAAARTHMANERTLLAYARTGLAFLVAGVSGVHLLDRGAWQLLAWSFTALGPAVAAFGIWRFARIRRKVR